MFDFWDLLKYNNEKILGTYVFSILTSIISVYLFIYNYHLIGNFLDENNIPKNIQISTISLGTQIDSTFLVTVLQVGIILYIFSKLKEL